ncbi:RusA family crossover junction endodeoxyribonuclease [Hymenobacter metallicola]|uniref:RusA family crossover junction endodeoxyribonuclease n=1 Tax=Hymenobacter metallicola TaxID=2563114 RepID=A0A4Z0QJB0_9BACT|nr:RusA family crossover junction endodeoxyribonuclease [Hymenobacter metallicola]TGE29775.1 RusA family crossover junction endodeoxyribonuclease [Hymenobacter metallicola]
MARIGLSQEQLDKLTQRNPHLRVAAAERPAPTAKVVPHPAVQEFIDRIQTESAIAPLVFIVEPMGAPRQTRKDKWANPPREVIARYRATKDVIRAQALQQGYELGPTLHICFEVSMPASWSNKKKDQLRGKPHQQKPDVDNMSKLWMDAFHIDDSHVHTLHASKVWADTGRILVYPEKP